MTGDLDIAVYIHWPFCRSKCPYCDFNSHVRDAVDQDAWRDALVAELGWYAARTPGRVVTSVFFGGGTPSLMPPETAAAAIDAVKAHWRTAGDLEITLEANPTSVEAANFRQLADAGVNRVSLGVQSLDDEALRWLGREHSSREALAAVELAAEIFPRFSFDLIYARPGQTIDGWRTELDEALSHVGGHLSVYQLTFEPGTPLYARMRRGEVSPLDEDLAADLYEETQDRLGGAGLPAYEISNHARPGEECRHNLTYWRYGDYVGVGPGAHGRLSVGGRRIGTVGHRSPDDWLANVRKTGNGQREEVAIALSERYEEAVMMGLRLSEGLDEDRLRAVAGAGFERLPADRIEMLEDGGLIERFSTRLRVTSAGRLRLNAITAELLAAPSRATTAQPR